MLIFCGSYGVVGGMEPIVRTRDFAPMPHVIIEYSANLDGDLAMPALAASLHRAALETGVFPIGGCRTRLARREHYVIGDGHPDNRFIHVQARIGAGRPADVRQRAAEQIFAALKRETAAVFASRPLGLTLEIVEIDPVGALKHNNLHEIIAGRQKAAATNTAATVQP